MNAEIQARLEANKAALGLKLVGGAAEFQVAAESNPTATPASYVFLLDESPQENEWEGALIQPVVETVGIVHVVRNVADPKGAAAGADMTALRQAVKKKLLGWKPAEGYEPLQRGPGRLLAFRDGHMWWQDLYFSTTYDRSEL